MEDGCRLKKEETTEEESRKEKGERKAQLSACQRSVLWAGNLVDSNFVQWCVMYSVLLIVLTHFYR